MKTVIIKVENFDAGLKRFQKAWQTGKQQGEFVTFETVDDILKTLTSRRWELLKMLQAAGPMSPRALARQLERDVKNVHTDVTVLKELNLIEDHEKGLAVPYDKIEAHLTLSVAA